MSDCTAQPSRLATFNSASNIVNQVGQQIIHGSQTITHTIALSKDDVHWQCLCSLQCPPDPLQIKSRLKERKGRLLREAITWVLQDSRYQQWLSGDEICLLWICGGAGKGKTMISIGVAEQLATMSAQPTDPPSAVIYFFCQYSDDRLNTVEAILKGLILRLYDAQESTRSALRFLWDETNKRPYAKERSLRELWDIFEAMLEQCSRRIYVVVDALDECNHAGMTDLLRLIVRTGLGRPSQLKWLLTSRPFAEAERMLLTSREEMQLSLEFASAHITQAVSTYVSRKVDELDRRHMYTTELRHALQEQLAGKAEGTFLWVSLVCQRLEDVPPDQALETVAGSAAGLDAVYARVSDEILREEPSIVKASMRLLDVMTRAFRPLSLPEINSITDCCITEKTVRRCASFVQIQEQKIVFVHKSALNYLLRHRGVHPMGSVGVPYDH